MKPTTILLATLLPLGLGACTATTTGAAAEPEPATDINQASLCRLDGWDPAVARESCTAGQKVVFLPERWGNEQLPVLFAAAHCDLRYSVALTNGAVACIYAPLAAPEEDEQEEADSSAEGDGS